MEQWISENLVALIGTVASLVAAGAAISAARATKRQAQILDRQSQRQLPAITVDFRVQDDSSGWCSAYVTMTNRSDTRVVLERISVSRLSGCQLLTEQQMFIDPYGLGRKIREPMPPGTTDLNIDLYAEPAGSPPWGGGRGGYTAAKTGCSIHLRCPPSSKSFHLPFWRRSASRVVDMRFTLSWSDSIERRFKMTQKIKLPAVTSSETP